MFQIRLEYLGDLLFVQFYQFVLHQYVDFYNSLKKKEKKKLNDEKFESRIVQNPKIGFWEKLLDKMKR